MTHRAETIMVAVVTAVTGLTTTGSRVKRGRVRTVLTPPALSVEMGADDVSPDRSSFPLIERDLNVKIIIHVQDNDEPDTQLNLVREEVYAALLADTTLGESFVVDTESIGDDEPELTGDADQVTGSQQMNFVVKYRHSWDDAGA